MYKKLESFKYLERQGFNTHEYYVPISYEDLKSVVNRYKLCTIRFDNEGTASDLPFYVVDASIAVESKYIEIRELARTSNCILIVSNGIKYDSVQIFNATVYLEKNGEFMSETSNLKVPLRHMYRDKTFTCRGSVADDISEWRCDIKEYSHTNTELTIDKVKLKDIILDLYTKEIFDKWFELTRYPINVGKLQENVVYWQIK